MLILVADPSKITWIWHDAELSSILLEWSHSVGLSARLRCEINPEEDRQDLIEMGITTQLVNVLFRDVRRLRSNIPDVTDGQPFMLDWDIISNTSIDGYSTDLQTSRHAGLPHHIIGCSDGSTIDIVFTELWLEEVNAETTRQIG
jgi:hypothetical protein